MKQTLIIIILVFFVSCVGHNENMSYSNHIQQIDSIVSAGINKDSLEIILAGYKAGRDDVERMVLMRELGRAYRESSDFGKALDYHEEALSLAKELKDTSNIIFILNQLGTDFRRMGALNEAAEKHYEALSYCGKYSDRTSPGAQKQRVVSLNGIGNVHLSLQNYDAAESVFKSALSGEKRLGSHLGQAINYANIGYVKEANGDKDSAWIYYEYSMEQNRLANSKLGISLCYNHFGRLSEQDGDYAKALESYKNFKFRK